MGLALVVVLLGAFSFLVYHKYHLKQANLAQETPTQEAAGGQSTEDQAIANRVRQQQENLAEFQPPSTSEEEPLATPQFNSDERRFEATSFPTVSDQPVAATADSSPARSSATDAPVFDLTEPAPPEFEVAANDPFAALEAETAAGPSADARTSADTGDRSNPARSAEDPFAILEQSARPSGADSAANRQPLIAARGAESSPAGTVTDPAPFPAFGEPTKAGTSAAATSSDSDASRQNSALAASAQPLTEPAPQTDFPSFGGEASTGEDAALTATTPIPVFPTSRAREIAPEDEQDQWMAATDTSATPNISAAGPVQDSSSAAAPVERSGPALFDSLAEPPEAGVAAAPALEVTDQPPFSEAPFPPANESSAPSEASAPNESVANNSSAAESELVLSLPDHHEATSFPDGNPSTGFDSAASIADQGAGSDETAVPAAVAGSIPPRKMRAGEEFLFPTPAADARTAPDGSVQPAAGIAQFVNDEPVQQVAGVADECEVFTVQPEDNYWKISRRAYGTARYFSSLALYNQHRIPDPRKLRPGMKVLIPAPEVLQKRYPEFFEDFRTKQKLPTGFFVQSDGTPAYRVGERETLSEISQRHLGRASRWIQIYRMNQQNLSDPNKLKPGTVLTLPEDATNVRITP